MLPDGTDSRHRPGRRRTVHTSLRGRGRAAGALAASVALVGTSVACVVAAAGADSAAVTVSTVDRGARPPQPTRAEVLGALQVKLAEDGRQLPPGWQDWPTQQLRMRLLAEIHRDIGPEDLDPGMDYHPCGAWTKVFKPGCW